ncbi:MAG: S-layer homology domain-containing protein [Acutalibacter sp.]
MYAAKAAGLMKGDAGTGNFRPTSTITRAEAASIMMNAKNAGLIK